MGVMLKTNRVKRHKYYWIGLCLILFFQGCLKPGVHPSWRKKIPPVPLPAIRINQVGYFPGGPKLAVLVSEATSPVGWELRDGTQKTIITGKTAPKGVDPDSGEPLHHIDFSDVRAEGVGFTLIAGGHTSPSFAIRKDIYATLRWDALHYFYLNRSGEHIRLPFAKDRKWTRDPGHLSDKSVPCERLRYCRYKLDVTGGWYDAGDYGKYVVNGGFTTWLLFNMYERTLRAGKDANFRDATLLIPERRNGIPDVLDEARVEMSWMLRMQVPDGEKRAGMVHHKMHDSAWSPLGMAPETYATTPRILKRPSTAATLNLAAAGAVAARLFEVFDPAFAEVCLSAAERAWRAALENPDIYASHTDVRGGGPYGDDEVRDDFFWAAAELFLTTKKAEYWDRVEASAYYTAPSKEAGGSESAFNWATTDALGTISLAIADPATLPSKQAPHRDALVERADQYLQLIARQGYRFPFRPGYYPWGSTSFVLNNAIVLAYAYDFTGEGRYLDGVVLAMDYILGRNANHKSYVAGYGADPMKHPHHRFWAHSMSDALPPPPPGSLSGGPNSNLEDPAIDQERFGCAPAKCYLDNIQSYSTNEVAINWNGALAWVAAFLDDVNNPQ